jgi:hypothetical protein
VRSASLAGGGTSKKRPSPHVHKVPTRINKMSLRTFRTALVSCSEGWIVMLNQAVTVFVATSVRYLVQSS